MDDNCNYCDGPTTPEPTTTNAPIMCPEGWLDLGYHGCMKFVQDNGTMNWFEAQVLCNKLNPKAFLAEIHSAEAQLIISALASELEYDPWWLGATDFFSVSLKDTSRALYYTFKSIF